VRAAIEDDHVHMVLLTCGSVLCGTLVRGDIPDTAPELERELCFAQPPGADGAFVGASGRGHVMAHRSSATPSRRGRRARTAAGVVVPKDERERLCSDASVTSPARELWP
jgi:hypothetical protein